MTSKSWALGPETSEARMLTASLLVAVARSLLRVARLARRVARSDAREPMVLEFYAEAGAPEGALYVDGQLVGHVSGVSRL